MFDLLWVIFVAYNIFENSAWVALSEGWTFTTIGKYVKYAIAVLCLAVIVYNLVKKRYTKQAIIAYLLLGAVFAATAYFAYDHTYVWIFLIFAAAYRQDAKRVIRITIMTIAVMLFVIIGASQTGLAVDYIFNPNTRARHGLGFAWTTNAPIIYLFFIFGYLFLRRERMKFYEYLILEAVAVYFYVMTNTQLTFFMSTAILIFLFVEGLLKNRWKFWKRLNWLWILLPVIICLLTLVIYLAYNPDAAIWSKLNSLLHDRLTLGNSGIHNYGITAFGQSIYWNGYFINHMSGDYNYVDCSYLQYLLEFGIAFLLAVLAIYTNAMYNAVKKQDYYLVWILAAILLFSFTEPHLMHLSFNAFPLIAFLSLKDAAEISIE